MYFLKSAFNSIRKNYLMTFASIFVLIACMLIIGSAYLCSANISAFVDSMGADNEITAYISDDVEESEHQSLQDSILSAISNKLVLKEGESVNDYVQIDFVSKDEALKEWKAQLGDEGEYLELFEDDNPLRNEFRITVVEKHLDCFDLIATTIQDEFVPDQIAKLKDTRNLVNMLLSLRRVLNTLGFWIMLILAVVSWFIVSNTIKLAMYSRRHEINIMKYVGATNSFIRTPFILEGLIIGVCAAGVSFALQWVVYDYLLQPLIKNLSFMPIVSFASLCPMLIVYFGGIGLLVGFVASVFSINKYLKV
jgi:cell division transport system permease protein